MQTKKRKLENKNKRNFAKKVYWDLLDACEQNINELVECAKILFENKTYSKSFLMSYLALEELGKRLAICDYITDILSDEEFKKIFRDHHLKMAYLHNQCEITKKEDGTIWNEATIVYNIKKYQEFFVEKQKATYVDFDIESEEIISPLKIVTFEDAEKILKYVLKIIADTNYYEEVSERIGTKAFLK